MLGNNYLLWENEELIVCTPMNPHLAYSEGPIIVIKTKESIRNAWQDPTLTGNTFTLAAKVCQIIEKLELTSWFNIQTNGNWGLIDGAEPFFMSIFMDATKQNDGQSQ